MPAPSWVARPAYDSAALANVLGWAVNVIAPDAASSVELASNLDQSRCPVSLSAPDAAARSAPVSSIPASLIGSVDRPVRAICLVMVDGLGRHQLSARPGHAPFLSRLEGTDLRCGFPSTTAASLTTLTTGQPPGLTGMAGYSLRDPLTGQRTSLISWETSTPPAVWQPLSNWFEHLAAHGHLTAFIGQTKFDGSALTAAAFRGTKFVPTRTVPQRLKAAVTTARQNTLTYLYWGELDKTAHHHGWESPQWRAALEAFDGAMRELRQLLPDDVALWITADHGMVDTATGPRWDIAAEPALSQGVDVVAGEPRALHLYCAEPEAVAARWRTFLGDHAWILTKDQAIAEGLFGPVVTDRVRQMLGDVVVACAGTAEIVDSRTATKDALAMKGHHGSLTQAEMDIPFLVA